MSLHPLYARPFPVHHGAMSLRHHEIAEASHRILNPLDEAKVRLLGELVGARQGTRVLDLASGKGELLCRWAEWFGIEGVGVDISVVFDASARARARDLGVADRVRFVRADARTFAIDAGAFDVASCLGATWIGDGVQGTIALLRSAIRPRGHVLVGEPFFVDPPPAEAFEAFGFGPDEYVSLAATAERIEASEMRLVEMVVAGPDDWDRYEAAQWQAIDDWLLANPDDPDHADVAASLVRWRSTYLRWGRRYLGWAVFVLRPG